MSGFASHPCFAPGIPGVFARGEACRSLSDAAARVPEAADARIALGDPHNPYRRAQALALFEALPERAQTAILAAEPKA